MQMVKQNMVIINAQSDITTNYTFHIAAYTICGTFRRTLENHIYSIP